MIQASKSTEFLVFENLKLPMKGVVPLLLLRKIATTADSLFYRNHQLLERRSDVLILTPIHDNLRDNMNV